MTRDEPLNRDSSGRQEGHAHECVVSGCVDGGEVEAEDQEGISVWGGVIVDPQPLEQGLEVRG